MPRKVKTIEEKKLYFLAKNVRANQILCSSLDNDVVRDAIDDFLINDNQTWPQMLETLVYILVCHNETMRTELSKCNKAIEYPSKYPLSSIKQ